jgi:hypothetical protein
MYNYSKINKNKMNPVINNRKNDKIPSKNTFKFNIKDKSRIT